MVLGSYPDLTRFSLTFLVRPCRLLLIQMNYATRVLFPLHIYITTVMLPQDYDGGDCCPCTCVDGTYYSCGVNGYNCLDPSVSSGCDDTGENTFLVLGPRIKKH